jgi:indolepyruvate decarboxylase
MRQTLIQHVLSQLHSVGITAVFGVPGDYAFPINSAICEDERFRWIGSSNELNAAYAADGYARVKGFSAICTTQGAGELSAINGIAAGYAERVPIFHIVGMESTKARTNGLAMHHTLAAGRYDTFFEMADAVVCARAVLTPENCVAETRRLIAMALYERRPVYIGIPADYAAAQIDISSSVLPFTPPRTDPIALEEAINAIIARLANAETACMLPGIFLARYGLHDKALALLNASGLPFATMIMDKSIFDETHPAYLGMYFGHLINEETWKFIENCDCVLALAVLFADSSSGSGTGRVNPSNLIEIMPHSISVGATVFEHVEMKDVIQELTKRLPRYTGSMGPKQTDAPPFPLPQIEENAPLTADYLYARWNQFLKPGDSVLAEWGTLLIGLAMMRLPAGARFHNDTLWSSIGWATPAAFGVALAHPADRVILFTGDGAHQMTAQEVSQIARQKLKPIIFVLNNDAYMIERLTGGLLSSYYNDLAPWDYQALAKSLGCSDWFTVKVRTPRELDQALKQAEKCSTGAYIEVIVDKNVALPTALNKMSEFMLEIVSHNKET